MSLSSPQSFFLSSSRTMILSLHQHPSPSHLPPSTTTSTSIRHNHQLRHQNHHIPPPSPPPLPPPTTTSVRFRTDYQENLQYLRSLGILPNNPRFPIAPSRASLDRILLLIDFLDSSGISSTHLPKLASSCPQLFTSGLDPSDISPVFDFLVSDVGASKDDSAGFVLRCPSLLFSSVDHRLRPTLTFLRSIGVERLNIPNHLNAHLLNIRIERLVEKIEWLVGIGFDRDEAEAACGRMRALFGYSILNCMRPKYEYLVGEMRRGVEEVKEFPQYFGFSLDKRIMPRHLHLKKRGVRVSLRDLLVCGDDKFYRKWN